MLLVRDNLPRVGCSSGTIIGHSTRQLKQKSCLHLGILNPMYVLSRGTDLRYRGLRLTFKPNDRSTFEPDSAPPAAFIFWDEGRRRERLAGASHRIPQAWVGSAVNAVSGEDGMPSTAPTECAGEFLKRIRKPPMKGAFKQCVAVDRCKMASVCSLFWP